MTQTIITEAPMTQTQTAPAKPAHSLSIVTHDGIFHGDDATAFAIILLCMKYRHGFPQELSLTRTRDPQKVKAAKIAFDVGGEYAVDLAAGVMRLDHHQTGGAGARKNGVPYASAGLAWQHLGQDLVESVCEQHGIAHQSYAVWEAVDRQLIQPVDAADCGFSLAKEWAVEGVQPYTISAIVSGFNLRWDEQQVLNPAQVREETDRRFNEVTRRVVLPALESAIFGAVGVQKAKRIVAMHQKYHGDRVIVLGQFCPWVEEVVTNEAYRAVQFVVYKQSGEAKDTFMVQAVPDKLGSFGKRKALPKDWAGLRNAAEVPPGTKTLADVTGVEDAIFCHPGLFICGAGSLAGALKLAELAVNS